MKWVISILFFGLLVTPVTAQESGAVNAGLLPGIWYSQTQVYAGESISIFGGFYNRSTTTVESKVAFLIDGEVVATRDFTSKPDSLIELETEWTALFGKHKISLSITSANANLLSTASNEVELNVKRVITTETLKTEAVEVATGIVESIDSVAESLSEKILDMKKMEATKADVQISEDGTFSIGSTTASSSAGDLDSESQTRSAYNLALTFLSSVVLHWKLTLAAVVALLLLLKFTS